MTGKPVEYALPASDIPPCNLCRYLIVNTGQNLLSGVPGAHKIVVRLSGVHSFGVVGVGEPVSCVDVLTQQTEQLYIPPVQIWCPLQYSFFEEEGVDNDEMDLLPAFVCVPD